MSLLDNITLNTEKDKITRSALENLLLPGPYQVPGIGAVVYKDGKPVFSYIGGNAVLGPDGKSFSASSMFRIASVSKMFTVFSMLQLAESGVLDLDNDVSEYLGFKLRHPDFVNIPITCRMLASHISGIRDGCVYSTPPQIGLEEFFYPEGLYWENGAHFAPKSEPVNRYFSYCNLNYGILGTIIERVTGQRFDIYQKNNILSQLNIKGGYMPQNIKPSNSLGNIYRKLQSDGSWCWKGEWQIAIDDYCCSLSRDTVVLQNPYAENINGCYSLENYVSGNNATSLAPQGGLRLSLEDMSHVLEMLVNKGIFKGKQILSPKSITELTDSQWKFDPVLFNGDTCGGTLLSYGLGTYRITGNSTARVCQDFEIDLVGHTGEAFGLQSGLFYCPDTKDGFAYIINGTALSEDDQLAQGRFSGNFIWEETIMDALCNYIVNGDNI